MGHKTRKRRLDEEIAQAFRDDKAQAEFAKWLYTGDAAEIYVAGGIATKPPPAIPLTKEDALAHLHRKTLDRKAEEGRAA